MKKISIKTYLIRALTLLGLFVLVSLVQLPVQIMATQKHLTTIEIMVGSIVYLGFFIGVIWIAFAAYRSVFRQQKHKLTWTDIKLIIKFQLLFYIVEISLSFLNSLIYQQDGTQNNQIIYSLVKSNPTVLILMAFTMTFLSPILEELIFRGYLIKGFFANARPLFPILVSGGLFSVAHVSTNIISFLIYMSLGMILSYIYLKQDKIEVSIGLHFLNNLIATIMMLISVM